MTIYVTKYALTSGIIEHHDAKPTTSGDGYTVPATYDENGRLFTFAQSFFNKDVHLTRESAVARAEVMRAAKVKSVKTQLKKLESMKF